MKRSLLLPAAWLLDQIAGDPEWLPHPVRIIGLASKHGEAAVRRPGQSELTEFYSGGALTLAIVAVTYWSTREVIRVAGRRSPALGNAVELLLAWTCLAARSLQQEATSVGDALALSDPGNVLFARRRLARIVGRDTADLEAYEICRAVIETVAESASDGIIAPIFYMAMGGLPLAMAYKAVNTLDSIIGHANQRYFYFGKASARLDDGMNYLPARLTALAIVAAARIDGQANPLAGWQTWQRDGNKHKSPNAGQPESAMAGALQVQLGGANTYDGELVQAPRLGCEFPPPSLSHVRMAIRLVSAVTILGVACGVLLASCREALAAKGSSRCSH